MAPELSTGTRQSGERERPEVVDHLPSSRKMRSEPPDQEQQDSAKVLWSGCGTGAGVCDGSSNGIEIATRDSHPEPNHGSGISRPNRHWSGDGREHW
jgi:hypothetical protein